MQKFQTLASQNNTEADKCTFVDLKLWSIAFWQILFSTNLILNHPSCDKTNFQPSKFLTKPTFDKAFSNIRDKKTWMDFRTKKFGIVIVVAWKVSKCDCNEVRFEISSIT